MRLFELDCISPIILWNGLKRLVHVDWLCPSLLNCCFFRIIATVVATLVASSSYKIQSLEVVNLIAYLIPFTSGCQLQLWHLGHDRCLGTYDRHLHVVVSVSVQWEQLKVHSARGFGGFGDLTFSYLFLVSHQSPVEEIKIATKQTLNLQHWKSFVTLYPLHRKGACFLSKKLQKHTISVAGGPSQTGKNRQEHNYKQRMPLKILKIVHLVDSIAKIFWIRWSNCPLLMVLMALDLRLVVRAIFPWALRGWSTLTSLFSEGVLQPPTRKMDRAFINWFN